MIRLRDLMSRKRAVEAASEESESAALKLLAEPVEG